MPKILHFSDADIGATSYGRRDPQSGLPVRVIDYLESLDTIIETAITENVSLVLFTGNAYHHPTPSLTLQREWGRRIMRLSKAGIHTLMLVGSRDLASSLHRAHTLEAFDTLDVPYVCVVDKPAFLPIPAPSLKGGRGWGGELGLQIIALPWFPTPTPLQLPPEGGRNGGGSNTAQGLIQLVQGWLESADPTLPIILAAHAVVEGGNIRHDALDGLILPLSLLRDPRLDYVALGHSLKAQELNPDNHPAVVYPGSIERSDFNEAGQDKYFILADIERGLSRLEWRKLESVRPLFNGFLKLEPGLAPPSSAEVTAKIEKALPSPKELKGAMVRLVLEYPREWETWVDEAALQSVVADTFSFHLVKRPYRQSVVQVPTGQSVGSLPTMDLLDIYWQSNQIPAEDRKTLLRLAQSLIEANDG